MRQNDVRLLRKQFRSKRIEAVRLTVRVARLQYEIFALDITELAQAFFQNVNSSISEQVVPRTKVKKSDAPHFALLRKSGPRQKQSRAERGNDLSTLHPQLRFPLPTTPPGKPAFVA